VVVEQIGRVADRHDQREQRRGAGPGVRWRNA